MTSNNWLWIFWGINTAIYYYVGRFVVSRPLHRLPLFFIGPNMQNKLLVAVCLPQIGYLAIVVAGFFLTDSGWWLLTASAVAIVVLAVHPQIHFW